MMYHCKTHGDWDANKASGCPECVSDARYKIGQLHQAIGRLIAAAESYHASPFDLVEIRKYDEAKRNARGFLPATGLDDAQQLNSEGHNMSTQQGAQQEVTIACSIEQALVMSKALEIYMRLGIGQIGTVSELLRDGVIPMKSESGEPRIEPPFHVVDDFEVLMNQAKALLGFSAGASNGIGHRNNDVSTNRAYQMIKNLRHALARHRNPEGGVGVDFDNPNTLNYTGEAPPVVKILEMNTSQRKEMNTYTLYWRTGKRETVQGTDPEQAMTLAGYGSGAVRALDFYANGDDHDYEWDSNKRDWVRGRNN